MATAIETTEQTRSNVPALTPEGERFALAQRQAKMFAMSPLVPDHLRKGPPEQAIANCWIALNLAQAMDEMPLIVMQNIHIINGKAGFASKYMIARANASGKFKDDIDWIESGEGKNLSVTCFATLAKSGKRVEMTADMAMAEAEGWTRNAKYKTMPKVMLRYRSASFLVNMYAPEVMLGYRTAEEIEDVIAAAVPINEPLTSDMLLNQSRPQETVDQVTGEVVEPEAATNEEDTQEASGTAREAPSAEESTSASSVTDGASTDGPASDESPAQAHSEELDPNTNDVHPAQPKCDEILREIEDAAAIIDINSIVSRHREDIEAMPDEMQIKIEVAADKRKNAIRAEREKASV
jgi:hypothetical protein